jgi:hypothetical protein
MDAVETESRTRSAGGMTAAVVLREHLHVLVAFAAIDLVLDAKVGEVDAIIEVRQFVVLRPSADLFLVAVRPAVTIGLVAVVVLEEGLVLPLEVLFDDDTADLHVSVLLLETRFLLAKCGVQVGVVIEFARAVHASVERLGLTLVAFSATSVEQVATLVRENDRLVVFVERNGPDQTFVAKMLDCVAVRRVVSVNSEFALWHNAERADHSECAAVLAIQLVDAVAVDDQFARLTARQVEVVHQPVARVVVGPVALVVHARTAVVAFAWVVPSRVVHKPSCVVLAVVRMCVKAPGQELRGAIQASPWRAGSKIAAPKAGS